MSDADTNTETQRAFYAQGDHQHLRPSEGGFYTAKLTRKLVARLGIGPRDRVLEVGAGFGRFTFDLLEHCGAVVAADLSERALGELDRARSVRGIGSDRCRTLAGDLNALTLDALGEPVDFVVGFFLLHHLSDFGQSIGRLAGLLRPGGGIGFVEPNRRNPLFFAQVLACADMDWESEKGMFTLRKAAVEQAYREAGLASVETATCGMFPPQVLERIALSRRLEESIEASSLFTAWLPFLLLTASAPAEPGRP